MDKKRKKKIVWHSNHSSARTGLGRNSKPLLKYLVSLDKYDIVEYAAGISWSNPALRNKAWPSFGTLPDDTAAWNRLQKEDNTQSKLVNYGSQFIDKIIREQKPDIYIGSEDIWSFWNYQHKLWWPKINTVIHTTLDSIPIFDVALKMEERTTRFFTWSIFAKNEMNKLGHKKVECIHGILEDDKFFKLSKEQRKKLRKQNNITEKAFIIGFVFRNQLRKSVPNLLEGFQKFIKENPDANPYLLLHTHWHVSMEKGEASWDIVRLIKDTKVDPNRVLTTYYCPYCKNQKVQPFTKLEENCPFCGQEKGLKNASYLISVSEKQLNEVYNLMDVYVHPFTSGGQELPCQESKLTELVTLVTDYACGSEMSGEGTGGFSLTWDKYFEQTTNFIKASTNADDIAKKLEMVYKMPQEEKERLGKIARDFVVKNYSTEVIGRQWETLIDELPLIDWDFDFTEPPKNPDYEPKNIQDDREWVIDLYKGIFNIWVYKDDSGLNDIIDKMKEGMSREEVLKRLKQNVLTQEQQTKSQVSFESLLGDEGKENRILLIQPESIGDIFMVTSLFESLKELYPDKNLYFACKEQYRSLVDGNPYVYKWLPYISNMDSLVWLEGFKEHPGFFEVALLPFIGTQKHLNYLHGGDKDNIAFNLKK